MKTDKVVVFASLLMAGACFGIAGFLMNALFSALERRLVPWRHDSGHVAQ